MEGTKYLSHPEELVLPPQSDVFVVPCCSKQFIIWMNCETPKLTTVPKNDLKNFKKVWQRIWWRKVKFSHLVESPLKRSFQNVIFGRPYVDIPIVSTRSLRVYRSNTTSRFWELKLSVFQHLYRFIFTFLANLCVCNTFIVL